MTFTEQLRQIKRLHELIKRKATGSPKQLADRMNISRATAFRRVEDLKDLGAEIAYCRDRQSYYYELPFELVL